jgi:hypothetical protein
MSIGKCSSAVNLTGNLLNEFRYQYGRDLSSSSVSRRLANR